MLLAIRDCRLTPLEEAKDRLPKELFAVLEKALARDPGQRFQDAATFSQWLAPFVPDRGAARRELAARVTSVQAVSSERQLAELGGSVGALKLTCEPACLLFVDGEAAGSSGSLWGSPGSCQTAGSAAVPGRIARRG